MKIHLLVEPKMLPVPDNMEVLDDYGNLQLMVDGPPSVVTGRHMVVEGEEKAISEWLRPFDGVWIEKGNFNSLRSVISGQRYEQVGWV